MARKNVRKIDHRAGESDKSVFSVFPYTINRNRRFVAIAAAEIAASNDVTSHMAAIITLSSAWPMGKSRPQRRRKSSRNI